MHFNGINCPKCKKWLTSKDGFAPDQRIACSKCKTEFAIAGPKTETPDKSPEGERSKRVEKPLPVPKQVVKRVVEPPDDDEEAISFGRQSSTDFGQVKRRRIRVRRNEPKKLSPFKRLKASFWVRTAVVALLLASVTVALYFSLLKEAAK